MAVFSTAVLLAVAAALVAAAGASTVVALAGAVLAAGAGVALLVVVGVAGWVALEAPLSWLQAASASRAAHRIGKRFNMEYLGVWRKKGNANPAVGALPIRAWQQVF
jgi:hypothetical protein